VLPGFYRVAASHAGCRAGSRPQALTKILSVPPAALGLRLTLRCPHLTRRRTHTRLSVHRLAHNQYVLTATVRGHRPLGMVTFRSGAKRLGTAAVDPRHGTARLTVHARSLNKPAARYQGDARNQPSNTRA
jgi:hypothetical protein